MGLKRNLSVIIISQWIYKHLSLEKLLSHEILQQISLTSLNDSEIITAYCLWHNTELLFYSIKILFNSLLFCANFSFPQSPSKNYLRRCLKKSKMLGILLVHMIFISCEKYMVPTKLQ
jgi:hypothetical protein